ncbi:hypothetical protein T4B_10484 [Trichinella pseudospiralis]|uniref:Uncharacterized protein n=1 Tax=Trichinella pseudospiralis TaxID=6337 RepID=A0A0V1EEX5_TRIPS|nr:hypothetical protein T4A_11389 [Trichinella pseudospiralis]KRZ26419.1 hypothetical protein T4B_10484 [Trichinella pseudospiralis]
MNIAPSLMLAKFEKSKNGYLYLICWLIDDHDTGRARNSAVICRIASTPPPPMNKSISDVTFHWLPASNWLFTFSTKEKEID